MHKSRSATMKDVAQCSGFSTATISRVLNDDPKVKKETRTSVLNCMEKLGYTVNPIARSLKTSRTHTIGIIAPEFQNDFFMAVAEGIEDYLRGKGYFSFICNSRESSAEEEALIRMLIEKQVDGMIIIPADCQNGDHLHILQDLDIPFVLVDRLVAGIPADAVLTDNFRGSFEAVERCILDGAGKIAFIGGKMALTSAGERYEGYIAAMKKYGKPIDQSILKYGDMHIESGYKLMGELVESMPDIAYVFIINLFMRIGAEKYLVEHGVSMNIRIAAFDESSISSLFTHSWITVRQPLAGIGQQSARLLLRRIRKEDLPFPQVYRKTPVIVTYRGM